MKSADCKRILLRQGQKNTPGPKQSNGSGVKLCWMIAVMLLRNDKGLRCPNITLPEGAYIAFCERERV